MLSLARPGFHRDLLPEAKRSASASASNASLVLSCISSKRLHTAGGVRTTEGPRQRGEKLVGTAGRELRGTRVGPRCPADNTVYTTYSPPIAASLPRDLAI